MILKSLLITAACSTLLVSQLAFAVSGIGSGSNLVKTGEEWKTNFNYTNSDCKKFGYDAGTVKIKGKSYCAKSKDVKSLNLKVKNSKKWDKRTSETEWVTCNKNTASCSQSLSTGKNSCVSVSSSVTKGVTVTGNIEGTLIKDFLKLGASSAASKSWTKTQGSSICASSDIRVTCTAKPKTRIRLEHYNVMQRHKGDASVKGYKMRQKRILYKNKHTGKKSSEVTGTWLGYDAKTEVVKGAVESNLPVSRHAVCNAQKV